MTRIQNPYDDLWNPSNPWSVMGRWGKAALGKPPARRAKRLHANTLVVMGGPNICLEPDRQLATWSTNLRGLTKGITRMRTTSLIRHCRPAGPPRRRRHHRGGLSDDLCGPR
jgi:hypothetical protein